MATSTPDPTGADMAAAVLVSPGRVVYRREPVPVPSSGELLVRVLASGICGSDLATYRGTHPYKKPPVILGHELAGRVVRLGPDTAGFTVGDLVCSAAFSPCDACPACLRGSPNLCGARANLCHEGWEGSFAEYVLLRRNMTFRLPANLNPELGALVEPLSIGLHAARLAEPAPGPGVLVLGSGSIGMSCLVAARMLGLGPVVCVDRGPTKGEIGRRLGAAGYVDAARQNLVDGAVAALGDLPWVTFVASGHDGVLADACAVTRPGGTVVVVSYFDRPHPVELNAFVSRELTLRFSALSTPGDFAQVIAGLTTGELDPTAMITHRFPLAEADAAIALLDSSNGEVGKVMLRPTDHDPDSTGDPT